MVPVMKVANSVRMRFATVRSVLPIVGSANGLNGLRALSPAVRELTVDPELLKEMLLTVLLSLLIKMNPAISRPARKTVECRNLVSGRLVQMRAVMERPLALALWRRILPMEGKPVHPSLRFPHVWVSAVAFLTVPQPALILVRF